MDELREAIEDLCDEVRYLFYRIGRFFVYSYQKLTRGFSDKDTWSLDWSLINWVYPRFKRYRELNNGYPPSLNEDEWENILDDIEYFMCKYIEDGNWCYNLSAEEEERFNRGKSYWDTYWRNLWW